MQFRSDPVIIAFPFMTFSSWQRVSRSAFSRSLRLFCGHSVSPLLAFWGRSTWSLYVYVIDVVPSREAGLPIPAEANSTAFQSPVITHFLQGPHGLGHRLSAPHRFFSSAAKSLVECFMERLICSAHRTILPYVAHDPITHNNRFHFDLRYAALHSGEWSEALCLKTSLLITGAIIRHTGLCARKFARTVVISM